jgi:hypothetical protein
MTLLTRFAFWMYAVLLRLYPRYYREEYGEEVTAVFQQHLQQAAANSTYSRPPPPAHGMPWPSSGASCATGR